MVAVVAQQQASKPVAGPSFHGTYETLHKASDLHKAHDHRLAVILGSGTSLDEDHFDFSQLDREWISVFAINCEPFKDTAREFVPEFWIFYDAGVYNRHNGKGICSCCSRGGVPQLSTFIITSRCQHRPVRRKSD